MPLIPLLAQAPAPPSGDDMTALVEEFITAQALGPAGDIGAWIIASQVILILACWLASKVIAREADTLGNAVKTWAFYFFSMACVSILLFAGVALAVARGSTGLMLAALAVSLLLFTVVLIQTPMRVYKVRLARALGFIGLCIVFVIVGQVAAATFIEPPQPRPEQTAIVTKIKALPPEQQERFALKYQDRLFSQKGAVPNSKDATAADKSKTLEERRAALQEIHAELETRRRQLSSGGQAALDAYNRDEARYRELLTALEAEEEAAGK